MKETEIASYAKQLFDEYGSKAVAIAAKNAQSAQDDGDSDKADMWRHVEQALVSMKGPAES
jgi:hypothetical protein